MIKKNVLLCLTRIINSGIKTALYVTEDKQGGMVTRIDSLPPFWRKFAADREFRKADCSPQLRQIAHDLFHFSNRNFANNKALPAALTAAPKGQYKLDHHQSYRHHDSPVRHWEWGPTFLRIQSNSHLSG